MSLSEKPKTLLLAVTADQSLKLMIGFPQFMAEQGWRVHVVSGGDSKRSPEFYQGPSADVQNHIVPMRREISPWHDLRALVRWIRLLVRIKPDVVMLGTPKASLLGMVASMVSGVPFRVYLLRGLRLEGARGRQRLLLRQMERVTCGLSSHILAVSPSLRTVALKNGLTHEGKISVLGCGSSNGVYVPDIISSVGDSVLREQGSGGLAVIGFVGRVTPDKGLEDLAGAVALLAGRGLAVSVLIVGAEDEAGYMARLLSLMDCKVTCTGYVQDVRPYYRLMDVLVLPSRREGMPTVALEAAAHGVPVITTTATGCVDAVLAGKTGLTYRAGDVHALSDHLDLLLSDHGLRSVMGSQARQWALANFSRPAVWSRYGEFLRHGLDERGGSRSRRTAA